MTTGRINQITTRFFSQSRKGQQSSTPEVPDVRETTTRLRELVSIKSCGFERCRSKQTDVCPAQHGRTRASRREPARPLSNFTERAWPNGYSPPSCYRRKRKHCVHFRRQSATSVGFDFALRLFRLLGDSLTLLEHPGLGAVGAKRSDDRRTPSLRPQFLSAGDFSLAEGHLLRSVQVRENGTRNTRP